VQAPFFISSCQWREQSSKDRKRLLAGPLKPIPCPLNENAEGFAYRTSSEALTVALLPLLNVRVFSQGLKPDFSILSL
jgi:hypothetical protein